jgi:hypothetical protein
MKSHMLLLCTVLNEMGTRCCTSTTRDLKKIMRRVENEGLSFLTIALPNFCSDFQKCLDKGKVDPTDFVGYSKSGSLPRFLGGFFGRVFDPVSGVLLDDPCIDSIQAVRQICLLFSKVNLPCSEERERRAFANYHQTEKEVKEADRCLDYREIDKFKQMARLLWGPVLSIVDKSIYDIGIRPKHGPGSTADRLTSNGKYDQTHWTERLEIGFPAQDYLFASLRHFLEFEIYSDDSALTILTPEQELPVRVISVPKTLKTPRIIGIEPACMQYVQQAIAEKLVECLERNDTLSSFIGFQDQIPNREMARISSSDGTLATLDLSEASDRVSNQHVRYMTCSWLHLHDGVQACRSRKADLPGYGVLRIAKFASMGSALTFPLEAMVFLTIIFMAISDERRTPLSRRSLADYVGKVRVYGDDIVVPVDMVEAIVSRLHTFGYKVNAEKSFWTGKFRESCGKEYYNGHDVSVVKVREMLPTRRQHVQEIISTVSLRNQMYFAGNWETAKMLDELLGKLIPFPTVWPDSPGLGRHTLLEYETQRECPHLQRPLVKAVVIDAPLPSDLLDGYGALLKFFLKRGVEPFADRKHYERAGRPRSVNIKTRWVCPY